MSHLKQIALIVFFTYTTTLHAIETKNLFQGVTTEDLVATLIDTSINNITYMNVIYSGSPFAAGLFTQGQADGFDIDHGIMLTTGRIENAIGPGKCYKTTTSNRRSGDADLDALLGARTYDAAKIEFDFVAQGNRIEFKYVFASEEYNEWVGSDFNDAFGFFLDGKNIALVPNTTTPVSSNTINNQNNAEYYRDNHYPAPPVDDLALYQQTACQAGEVTHYFTEFDGFTTVLTATATVTPGELHHLKLVIVDGQDLSLDSAVLIQGKSFSAAAAADRPAITADPVPPPSPVTSCKLYGVNDEAINDSRFFVFDPQTQIIEELGTLHRGYDIESLHSHPVTKALYAASAINAKNGGGYLYQIDKSTGIMETLGTISLMNAEPVNNISGVAFNPTTNSFWGWVKSQGLFRLTLEEPIELKAELKLASQAKVEDLTWNAEGNMLYLAQGNQIWHYDGNQMNAVCSLASQKQKIEALESSSDGTLLLSIHGDTTIYQLDSQALAQNTQCPIQAFVSTPFDDIEGMAWVCTLQ